MSGKSKTQKHQHKIPTEKKDKRQKESEREKLNLLPK